MGNDFDLALAGLGDDDLVTEVADAALNLDAVVEELLESGEVEDLVVHGLRSVDDILQAKRLVLNISSWESWSKCDSCTYLLGDLLGLATTSLFTGEGYRLAYCSIVRSKSPRGC